MFNKTKISLIVTMLLFGSIGLFVRNIAFSSGQTALARGIIGALFLFIAGVLLRKRIAWSNIRKNLWILIASGIAIGVNWIFLFEAYKYTTISNATISYYFAPVFVMAAGPLLLKERLNGIRILCILAALAGMFLVAGADKGAFTGRSLIGIGYGLAAAAFYASVIIMNKFLKGISGLESTLVQLTAASAALLPYVLVNDGFSWGGADSRSVVLLLIVGIVHTGLGYLLYFSAMQRLTSQTIAAFSYLDPISAVLMSCLFLKEHMTFLQLAGGILILGATYVNER